MARAGLKRLPGCAAVLGLCLTLGATDSSHRLGVASVLRAGPARGRVALASVGKARLLRFGPVEADAPPPDYRAKWAVIIGIDDYPAGHGNLDRLDYAGNDAREFRALLLDRFGFRDDHIRFLTDKTVPGGVHVAQIKAALETWLPDQKPDGNDLVIVFFAGHGLMDWTQKEGNGHKGYIAGVESRSDDLPGTCLPVLTVRDGLANSTKIPCRHKLLILDSCYSGALFDEVDARPPLRTPARAAGQAGLAAVASGDRLRDDLDRRAFYGISAGGLTPVADGEGADKHSIFSSALLRVMRDSANSTRGWDHVFQFRALAEQVKSLVENAPKSRQVPAWGSIGAGAGEGDLVFRPTRLVPTTGELESIGEYNTRITTAQTAWFAGNITEAKKGLDGCAPALRRWEWNYLSRLCDTSLLDFRGYEIKSLAFTPDGGRLALAFMDMSAFTYGSPEGVKLCDLTSGKATQQSDRAGKCLAVSPDGTRIAAADKDGPAHTVRVWQIAAPEQALTLRGHGDAINAVAFSPDGKWLASASEDKTVRLWEAAAGTPGPVLKGHTSAVDSVAFSPDSRRLVSAGWDRVVKIWDTATGQALGSFPGHNGRIRSVAFSPDSRFLATAGDDQTVKLWNLSAGSLSLTLREHTKAVTRVAFSPDGRRLVTACDDQLLRVWNAGSGELVLTIRGHTHGLGDAAFSPNGQMLASCALIDSARVWDATTPQEYRPLYGQTSTVDCVAVSPDGALMAAGGLDKVVRIWDVATGDLRSELSGHTDTLTGLAFRPAGGQLASSSTDGTIRVWDLTTGQPIHVLRGHSDAEADKRMRAKIEGLVKDLAKAQARRENRVAEEAVIADQLRRGLIENLGRSDLVWAVAYSPDGRLLASGGDDKAIRLWDAETGNPRFALRGFSTRPRAVAFSPDGKTLAACCGAKAAPGQFIEHASAIVWEVATQRELFRTAEDSDYLTDVAFSPDGSQLAIADDDDRIVRICDATDGRELAKLEGHTGGVAGIAYSPDGSRLVSVSEDRTIRVWNTYTGQTILVLPTQAGSLHDVAFSPGGQWFTTAGDDGAVKTWDTQSNDPNRLAGLIRVNANWHRREMRAAAAEGNLFATFFHIDVLIRDNPSDWHAWGERAEIQAQNGRLDLAATDFRRAFELGVDDRTWSDWLWYADVLVKSGDLAGYRSFCKSLFDRYGMSPQAHIRRTLVRIGVLAPDALPNPAKLLDLARAELRESRTDHVVQYLEGAALFRAGRAEEAIASLEQAVKTHDSGGTVQAFVFLALAYRLTGHEPEAQTYLQKAEALVTAREQEAEGNPSKRVPWNIQLEIDLLIREAQGRGTDSPATTTEPARPR